MASMTCNWCFTINADEEHGEGDTWEKTATAELAPVELFDAGEMKCIYYQLEKAPTTGQRHLQGFLVTLKTARLTKVSKLLPHAHFEKMRGTVKQNVDYCSKAETKIAGPWSYGVLPVNQGRRTDWAVVRDDLSTGKTKQQVLLENPHLAPCFRGIEALVYALKPAPPKQRDINVFYLYGTTNTGKTHRAMNSCEDPYVITGRYIDGRSFDMYEGQSTLVLDEWTPEEWPLTVMNALLQQWKCPLNCRYNNKYGLWTTVIICTNVQPQDCYTVLLHAAQRDSFTRRLTHVVEIRGQHDPEIDFVTGAVTDAAPASAAPCASPALAVSSHTEAFVLAPGPPTPPLPSSLAPLSVSSFRRTVATSKDMGEHAVLKTKIKN